MMSLRRSVAAGPFSHTSIRNRYSQSAAFDFCIDFVKNHDFDNYLAGLMIPKHIRPHFYAIRAYNIEMSLVKDQANNNAMTARVRFQWWREIIESAYVEHTEISNEHPVAMALQVSIKQMKLNRRWVDRILESRQADVSTEQAVTLSDLETYAEQSSSSVLYLILEMLGIMQEKADYAASHVGVSYGLMTSLRSIAYLSAQNQVYIPHEITVKHSLPISVILRGPKTDSDKKALASSVFDIASQAHGHLEEAKKLIPNLPRNAIYALTPAVRCTMYLDDLLQCEFNPFHEKLLAHETPLWYQLRLLRFLYFKSL